MSIVKQHLVSIFEKNFREDGRKFDETRDISIEYGVSAKSAEGSARVKLGDTEVVAGVKLDVGTPFPDKDDEGSIVVNVELLPLSSPDFESGPPSVDAIELSRVVDRAIRESKALNFKDLCIEKGDKVWMVFIDIYPINNDGNLFDAAALAALAALKDTKYPTYKDGKVDYSKRTKKSLPLKELPVSCTVRMIGNSVFADPTTTEDKFFDARLTVAFTRKGDLCAFQKGGTQPLSTDKLFEMIDMAKKISFEYRKVLEK